MRLPQIDADELGSLVSWTDAIAAIGRAVAERDRGGPARMAVPVSGGELLVMPAATARSAGVKLAGVAPGNPAAGLPRIQAVYVLFDAATLTPRALIDGTALTTLRTPAQSAFAVRELATQNAGRLVVFGTGPQAWGHVHALRAVRPIRSVVMVGRTPAHVDALVERLKDEDIDARSGDPGAVGDADLVVCATTARSPVFDGRLLTDHACVVAVGSHEPQARELDDVVFERAAQVVVEDRATAVREAGDVIQAIAAGALAEDRLTELADVRRTGGISVFKGVGMGWQDLAVAEAAYDAWLRRGHDGGQAVR
jgi:ornithine cyclodeaminase/alanine dehydrogenase-like protein (mu-crystallin family)